MRLPALIIVCAAAVLTGRLAAAADAAPAPGLKSHFAKSGTNRIHYVTCGERGPVVALIHGWGGSTAFWREQIPVLKDKARVIAVDLPGHGRSDAPAADYAIDYFARAVIEVLKDARADRAIVAGHSMGVAVMCRVEMLAPGRVAGLVAVDGLLRRPKLEPEQAERFTAPFRTPAYRDRVKEFIGMMYPNPGTEALKEWTITEILKTPQHVLGGAMESMFKSAQVWDLERVKVPLIVINAKSPIWTADYESFARSRSDRVEYLTVEGPGHFLMLEKPVEFNAALLKALANTKLLP
jgi:pimeloyl-ACP methyl ester carboxylesterase